MAAPKLADKPSAQNVLDHHQILAETQAALAAERKSNNLLKRTIETLTKQRDEGRSTIDELRDKISGLEDEIDDQEELNARIEDLEADLRIRGDDVPDLVCARELLFKGDAKGGREQLERVLDRADNTWRCGGCNVGGSQW